MFIFLAALFIVELMVFSGFKFIGIGRLHKYDMWFVKGLTEGFLKDYNCKIHVTQLGGDAANCLQVFTLRLCVYVRGNSKTTLIRTF